MCKKSKGSHYFETTYTSIWNKPEQNKTFLERFPFTSTKKRFIYNHSKNVNHMGEACSASHLNIRVTSSTISCAYTIASIKCGCGSNVDKNIYAMFCCIEAVIAVLLVPFTFESYSLSLQTDILPVHF